MEGDARSWSQDTQEQVRRSAVRAVEDQGLTYQEAAEVFGVHSSAIGRWMRTWREGGERALEKGRRGRRPGEQMVLTNRQQGAIRRAIEGKCPDQHMLAFCLWTREAVRDLIERRYGITLAIRTVGDYLARWGFTPQRPVQRAYEQDPEALARWLEVEYPALRKRAKRQGALIMWEDEMGLRSGDVGGGRSFHPRGVTPAVRKTGKRFGVNLVHAIANGGELSFKVFEGRFTAAVFIDFLERLVKGRTDGRKIILVVDGHPTHKAKVVTAWMRQHARQIELVFLPGYSPEVNPAEVANHDIKAEVLARHRPKTKLELLSLLRSHLFRRQKQPSVVASFFFEKHVRYAAA
ncbi:MAG: IS630 family transposase [Acidimicrobiales bacterium]